jgi:hypothetical protein
MTPKELAVWLEQWIERNRAKLKDDHVQQLSLIVAVLKTLNPEPEAK